MTQIEKLAQISGRVWLYQSSTTTVTWRNYNVIKATNVENVCMSWRHNSVMSLSAVPCLYIGTIKHTAHRYVYIKTQNNITSVLVSSLVRTRGYESMARNAAIGLFCQVDQYINSLVPKKSGSSF